MKLIKVFFISFLLSFFPSCKEDNNTAPIKNELPKAKGGFSDIIVVVNKNDWKNNLKAAFDSLVAFEVKGLYQPESEFDLVSISPEGFTDIFKSQRIILVIDKNKSATNNVSNSGKSGITFKFDKYAKGQLYIKLSGQSSTDIIQILSNQQQELNEILNLHRNKGLSKQLFESRNVELSNRLRKEHQINLIIPKDYVSVKSEDGFVYFAKKAKALCESGPNTQCSYQTGIFIHYFPYTNSAVFTPEFLVHKRDSISEIHLLGPDKKEIKTYMEVEKLFPLSSSKLEIAKKSAFEIRGWWNMVNATMGGPFVNYAFVDEVNHRVIMVDVFVFAPNFSKRNLIKELEAVAKSIQIQ